MNIRGRTHKKCPRCGNKCLLSQSTCEECGLIFARLEFASNKAAKKKLAHFDRDFVIYTNKYPKDVSWFKLLMIAFIFGLVGGQYYYVGKYVKAGLMSASFVYLIFCTVFNAQIISLPVGELAYLPVGVATFAWLYSLVMIGIKKFKVPVTIQMPEGDNK